MVFDDAVVNNRNGRPTPSPPEMRMGILVGSRAVSRPARMADPASTWGGLAVEQLFQSAHAAGPLAHIHFIPIECRQTRAVVAPIFEPPQPGDQDRRGLVGSGVTDDSAHRHGPSAKGLFSARFGFPRGPLGKNAATWHRQPGSTSSPAKFERNYNAGALFADIPRCHPA